jgi:hypothetical protein
VGCVSKYEPHPAAVAAAAAGSGCSAPDEVYDCPICYNETTRTKFWGFVSCVVNLQDLATGSDARLLNLTEMVHYLLCFVTCCNKLVTYYFRDLCYDQPYISSYFGKWYGLQPSRQ